MHSRLSKTVVPAGKDVTIVRPYSSDMNAAFVESFLGDKHAVVVSVCYCSVLHECWLVTTHEVPQPIGGEQACPIPEAKRFEQSRPRSSGMLSACAGPRRSRGAVRRRAASFEPGAWFRAEATITGACGASFTACVRCRPCTNPTHALVVDVPDRSRSVQA